MTVPPDESMLIVATGQKIGEGFDCPRLDTLMLASPVRFDGRLIQYIGRLNRAYGGKQNVIVYDYVDAHIGIFDSQYRTRLATYKRIGYKILSDPDTGHQNVNAIYDRGIEAKQELIISSPNIRRRKVDRMLYLLYPRMEAGVKVTVLTMDPNAICFGDPADVQEMISLMQQAGISVVLTKTEGEHYAVIDQKLVWHGGMNLLGREDAWDNLIRIESVKAAAELMEITHQQILKEKSE